MATAPSPNDLTRQQLDELDALLQRMLSVPLAPADTPMPAGMPPARNGDSAGGPPLPPLWRVDPPSPTAGASSPHIAIHEPPPVAPKLEVQQAPLPPAPPPPVPISTVSPPPLPASAPKPVAVAPAPTPAPKPPAPKVAPPVVYPPVPRAATPITPAPASPPASTSTPVALPLLPLVAFNGFFDSICGVFGPPGRLLRSGFFKHIYGFAGLALIAYTAAHIAQKASWLTLPISLPWPR
jgi:hypothetical protein